MVIDGARAPPRAVGARVTPVHNDSCVAPVAREGLDHRTLWTQYDIWTAPQISTTFCKHEIMQSNL